VERVGAGSWGFSEGGKYLGGNVLRAIKKSFFDFWEGVRQSGFLEVDKGGGEYRGELTKEIPSLRNGAVDRAF